MKSLSNPWNPSDVIRNKIGLTGTKKGCDVDECGPCTVLIDGVAVPSCLILAVEARDKEITIIEGLADGENLHPIQKAFLDENPYPTEDEIRESISGNLCRCTGYTKIVEAIQAASQSS